MSNDDHVTVTVSRDSVGVTRAGFGVPLILSATASWSSDLVRSYASLAEVATDFPITTSAEYLAAQAMFSQSPKPPLIKIGRTATARRPTQVYTGSAVAGNLLNSYAYVINVKGKGVTPTAVTYTSDASATNDEIVAGLVTALNLVVGKNYTAAVVVGAGDTDTFTVTGTAAGDWFSLEVNPAELVLRQTHADPGVATDLAAIAVVDNDWYDLVTLYNSNAYVLAAAAWINAVEKTYTPDIMDTDSVTGAVSGSDTLDDLKTFAYSRVDGVYHPRPNEMLSAAIMGRCLPIEPGGETRDGKRLVGVTPATLTSTWRTNLVNKYATFYETAFGVGVTSGGHTADGDWYDAQRGIDWVVSNIRSDFFTIKINNDKVPFEDDGIALYKNALVGIGVRAEDKRIAAKDSSVVEAPLAADVSSTDKAARTLPDLKLSFTLSGAIHHPYVTVVVSN